MKTKDHPPKVATQVATRARSAVPAPEGLAPSGPVPTTGAELLPRLMRAPDPLAAAPAGEEVDRLRSQLAAPLPAKVLNDLDSIPEVAARPLARALLATAAVVLGLDAAKLARTVIEACRSKRVQRTADMRRIILDSVADCAAPDSRTQRIARRLAGK